MIRISSDLVTRIVAAAQADPRSEVCGLLFGTERKVVEAQPCRNVAAEPQRRFEIDPAALLAAHRAARGGAPGIIGHYHSHPSGVAIPSACDAASATPDGTLWLIVAAGEVRGWRAVPAGVVEGRFDPVTLVITTDDNAACAPDSARPQHMPSTRG